MIMALARLIIFIAAVVGFTIFLLKIARDNSKRRSEAINQLIDLGEFVYAGSFFVSMMFFTFHKRFPREVLRHRKGKRNLESDGES